MTALDSYDRLEAAGLWRAGAEAQRREVVVSIGDATLKIADMSDKVLAHWSLAAVHRANPGQTPAIYHPDGDPGERLELGPDEHQMIDAIAQIQRAVARRKSRPGRLRLGLFVLGVAVMIAASVLWLPSGLRNYAMRVLPESQKAELGDALLAQLVRGAGAPCSTRSSAEILDRLARRLETQTILILPDGHVDALHLPGGLILLHRELVEDHDDPSVPAGYALAELQRLAQSDPLERMLIDTGLRGTLALLTTGTLPDAVLDSQAETLLTRTPDPADPAALLARFAAVGLPSTPYALAVDITGDSTRALIDGDPIQQGDAFIPPLSDSDWLRLQAICGG